MTLQVEKSEKFEEMKILIQRAFSNDAPPFPLLRLGKEVGEHYCQQFEENGYDKNYTNKFASSKALPQIIEKLTEEKLLNFFQTYKDSIFEWTQFRGKYYTLRNRELQPTSLWAQVEKEFADKLARRGDDLALVLKACYKLCVEKRLQSDNYPMISNEAADLGAEKLDKCLADLNTIGLVSKSKWDIRIDVELGPLVSKLLNDFEKTREIKESLPVPGSLVEVPDDLFSPIANYEEIKSFLKRALTAERLNVLFVGVPGSAKTIFLLELARLKGSFYCLGSATTKAGLAEILYEQQPRILLVDEIDKFEYKDLAVLLSLAETGIVRETKVSKQREVRLNTSIFAAANRTTGMREELLDRFTVLNLKPYGRDEFIEATKKVLVERQRVDADLATYIGERTFVASKGIREAIRIAKISKTRKEADEYFDLLTRYS